MRTKCIMEGIPLDAEISLLLLHLRVKHSPTSDPFTLQDFSIGTSGPEEATVLNKAARHNVFQLFKYCQSLLRINLEK